MNAIRALEDYLEKLQQAKPEIVSRLAERGEEIAESRFANAYYAGTNDVFVSSESDGDTATITAQGDAVAFIEFGTGVTHNGAGAYPQEVPEEIVGIGEYGHGHGSSYYGWYYSGEKGTGGEDVYRTLKDGSRRKREGWVHTYGNPPAAAMYRAANFMQEEAASIVREVLAE